jgi:hypothetical protein
MFTASAYIVHLCCCPRKLETQNSPGVVFKILDFASLLIMGTAAGLGFVAFSGVNLGPFQFLGCSIIPPFVLVGGCVVQGGFTFLFCICCRRRNSSPEIPFEKSDEEETTAAVSKNDKNEELNNLTQKLWSKTTSIRAKITLCNGNIDNIDFSLKPFKPIAISQSFESLNQTLLQIEQDTAELDSLIADYQEWDFSEWEEENRIVKGYNDQRTRILDDAERAKREVSRIRSVKTAYENFVSERKNDLDSLTTLREEVKRIRAKT